MQSGDRTLLILNVCCAQIAEQKQQNYQLAEQLEAAQAAGGSMAGLQAELQQLEQQLAAKDASMAELQQETERRAADSGEAREQLHQLQQELAELQRQQQAASQQAQQILSEVSSCCSLSLVLSSWFTAAV